MVRSDIRCVWEEYFNVLGMCISLGYYLWVLKFLFFFIVLFCWEWGWVWMWLVNEFWFCGLYFLGVFVKFNFKVFFFDCVIFLKFSVWDEIECV